MKINPFLDYLRLLSQKFTGNNIFGHLTGHGEIKLKVSWNNVSVNAEKDPQFTVNSLSLWQMVKAYHLMEPKDSCDQLSIRVSVEGKVKYTGELYSLITNQNHMQCWLKLQLH